KKQLTNDQFIKAGAAVSPDGRYVVFTTNRSGNVNIWRMDIDGNNLKQLTDGSSLDVEPIFSSDGKWVVFTSLRSGKNALWKVSVDGGTAVELTETITRHPAVSPDGKLIACFFVDEKGKTRIGI